MFVKRLIVSLGIIALATPALSAQYFVVQNASTKRCEVVDRQPDTGATIVGDGAYGDRDSAEADMKKIQVCTSQAGDAGSRPQDTSAPSAPR